MWQIRFLEKIQPLVTQQKMWLVLIGLVGCLYAPAFLGGFIYDDHLQVENNPAIRSVFNAPEFFKHSTGYYTKSPASYYRPLHMLVYSVTYLFFKTNPFGYHVMNALLAVLIGSMLFRILKEWFSPAEAALAVVIFTIHPQHVEAIAWIAALPELLGTLLLLWVFKWHLQPRWESQHYGAAGGVFFLALLTREHAAVFVLLALGLDALQVQRHKRFIRDRLWLRYVVYGLTLVAYFLLRYQALGFWFSNPDLHYPMSGERMFMNAIYLLAHYLGAFIVLPAHSAFHVFQPVSSWLEVRLLVAIAGLAAYAGLVRYLYQKDFRLFYFSLWLLVAFLPFLYFPALGENLMVERYMFLPSVGFAVLVSMGLITLYRKVSTPHWQQVVLLGMVGLFLGWSGTTWVRTFAWQNDITFCRQTLRSDPKAYHFYNLLATAYFQQGDVEGAKSLLRSFEHMFPGVRKPGAAMITAADVQALPATYRHYQKAYFEAQHQLAALYFQTNQFSDALAVYHRLRTVFPMNAGIVYFQALCFEKLGQRQEATKAFQLVLQLDPNHPEAGKHLAPQASMQSGAIDQVCTQARQLSEKGQPDQAIALLQDCIQSNPANAKLYHYLFNVYWITGQKDKAREAIYQAFKLEPENELYRFNYEALIK